MHTTAARWTQRGIALYRAGRDAEAIGALRRAVAAEAGPESWQYLAAALWRVERHQQALAVLRDAVLNDPDEAWTWLHLGRALRAAGRTDEAALALHEALALASDDSEALADWRRLSPAQQALPATLAHELAVPSAESTRRLAGLGILALGALQRAEPADEAAARVVLGLLGRLSPELARDRLATWARDDRPEQRLLAARLVAALVPVVGGLEALALELLADEEPPVRAAVAEPLLPLWVADDDELARLLSHPEPTVRQAALSAAVATGDGECLRRVYAAGESKVRLEALRGFSQLGAVDLLSLVLWDELPVLRGEAARLLAAGGATEVVEVLAERLAAESDEAARAALAAALSALQESPPCEAPAPA